MTAKSKIQVQILDRGAREKIRQEFEELEKELGIDGLGTVLTTAVLELVENAVKANLKRAFFTRNGYHLDEPASYDEGIKAFIKSYGEIKGQEYVAALTELALLVTVEMDVDEERLLVYVENNTILLATEEARIRRQLAKAMNVDKFVDFYLSYGDETEGSGLGLAMIVFLIRTLGFRADFFRVFQKDGRTTARLEFPMSTDYVPLRDRWARTNA